MTDVLTNVECINLHSTIFILKPSSSESSYIPSSFTFYYIYIKTNVTVLEFSITDQIYILLYLY